MRLSRILGGWRYTTQCVDPHANYLKMVWVDAWWVAAKMIDRQAILD